MTEGYPKRQSHETDEPQSNEQILEASVIFEKLIGVCEEVGYELDPTDLENILGQDENDLLGNLASFSLEQLGLDPEILYEKLGIDADFKVFHYTLGEVAQWDKFAQDVYVAALKRRREKMDEEQEA